MSDGLRPSMAPKVLVSTTDARYRLYGLERVFGRALQVNCKAVLGAITKAREDNQALELPIYRAYCSMIQRKR